mgnify:CR=1 FL=1
MERVGGRDGAGRGRGRGAEGRGTEGRFAGGRSGRAVVRKSALELAAEAAPPSTPEELEALRIPPNFMFKGLPPLPSLEGPSPLQQAAKAAPPVEGKPPLAPPPVRRDIAAAGRRPGVMPSHR